MRNACDSDSRCGLACDASTRDAKSLAMRVERCEPLSLNRRGPPRFQGFWATHRAGESEIWPASGPTTGPTSGPTSGPTRAPARAPTRVDFPFPVGQKRKSWCRGAKIKIVSRQLSLCQLPSPQGLFWKRNKSPGETVWEASSERIWARVTNYESKIVSRQWGDKFCPARHQDWPIFTRPCVVLKGPSAETGTRTLQKPSETLQKPFRNLLG